MKALSLIGPKAGSSPIEFRTYYETRHVPLALRHFRFDRYRRSYVVERDPTLPAFFVLSEFWSTDTAANRKVLETPAGAGIRADEDRFMGPPRMPAAATERVVRDGPTTDRRLVLFLDPEDETDLDPWLRSLPADRIDRDDVTPFVPTPDYPGRVVVSLWPPRLQALTPPAGIHCLGRALLETIETPKAVLEQARTAGS